MRKHVLMLATFAFILACGVAVAEESPGMRGPEGHGLMEQGGMRNCGMMRQRGMMGGGDMMGQGAVSRYSPYRHHA